MAEYPTSSETTTAYLLALKGDHELLAEAQREEGGERPS